MDIKRITGEAERIIECAKAIQDELENTSEEHEEAIQLYETLEGYGVTTDADEIVAAVELVAELSSEDAAEINSALELWESVEGNGHDPDDIEAALEVYAIVQEKLTCIDDLDGALQTSESWNEHCGQVWNTPEIMAAAYKELSEIVDARSGSRKEDRDIIAVFERVANFSIQSVEGAENALSLLGVSAKEQALLDAIKAFCEPA
jgi:hypothetical protein